MKPVVVLAEAAEDLERGRIFYDLQQAGVGDHFWKSLIIDLQRLEDQHGIHPVHFGFFRMLAGKFPFGVYYEVSQTAVEVYAILDLRRDPLWIRSELVQR
jgi:hypothetical protein